MGLDAVIIVVIFKLLIRFLTFYLIALKLLLQLLLL